MSTTNSEQFRFLHLTLGLGVLSALPFHLHPLGLQRPDGWMYTILHQLLPMIVLLRFHRPTLSDRVVTLMETVQSWIGTGMHSCLSSRMVYFKWRFTY